MWSKNNNYTQVNLTQQWTMDPFAMYSLLSMGISIAMLVCQGVSNL